MDIYLENTTDDQIMTKVADIQWLKDHEQAIRDVSPTTWTHVLNIDNAKLKKDLESLLDVKNVPNAVLACIMIYFEDIGMVLRKNIYLVRRNDTSIFKNV